MLKQVGTLLKNDDLKVARVRIIESAERMVSWMALVAALLTLGSLILAFVISWQVKYMSAEIYAVIRFNILMLPLLLAANVALGTAFIKANGIINNMPLVAAMQTFIYYIFLVLFAIFFLGDMISLSRALAGFGLIAAGIFLLKQ